MRVFCWSSSFNVSFLFLSLSYFSSKPCNSRLKRSSSLFFSSLTDSAESFKRLIVLSSSFTIFCNLRTSTVALSFSPMCFSLSISCLSFNCSSSTLRSSSESEHFLAIVARSSVSLLLRYSNSVIFNVKVPFSWFSLLSFAELASSWDRKRDSSLSMSRFAVSTSKYPFIFVSYSSIFTLRSLMVASFCSSISLKSLSTSSNFKRNRSDSLFNFLFSSSSISILFFIARVSFSHTRFCLVASSSSPATVMVSSLTAVVSSCFPFSSAEMVTFFCSNCLFKSAKSSS